MELPDEYGPPSEADERWYVLNMVANEPPPVRGPEPQLDGQISIDQAIADEIASRRGL